MTTIEAGTKLPTTEDVAQLVAGVPLIGLARHAIEAAGWTTRLVANRITVADAIVAYFMPGRREGAASWTVHALDGTPPTWIVGTEGRRA